MAQLLKLGLFLLALLLAVLLYARNDQPVVLDLYLTRIELPFIVALLIALCAGVLLAILANLPRFFRLRRENRQLKKQLQGYCEELDGLRTLPIKDQH